MLFGDGFQRGELVDARIVDEDIELPVGRLGGGKELIDLRFLGDVRADGNGLAARLGDFGDDAVRAFLA